MFHLGSSDSFDLIMKTRLGRKWRQRSQKAKEEVNREVQTSLTELPIIIANEDEQIQVEEIALRVITAITETATGHVKSKKKRRKKPAKIIETSGMPKRTTAVEKVRAAIEAKKQGRIPESAFTGGIEPFKLEVKDSLIKHRRSLIPRIEERVEKDEESLEIKKSKISMPRDSLELAKESIEARAIIKKAEESKLSLARDSLDVLKVTISN